MVSPKSQKICRFLLTVLLIGACQDQALAVSSADLTDCWKGGLDSASSEEYLTIEMSNGVLVCHYGTYYDQGCTINLDGDQIMLDWEDGNTRIFGTASYDVDESLEGDADVWYAGHTSSEKEHFGFRKTTGCRVPASYRQSHGYEPGVLFADTRRASPVRSKAWRAFIR